MGGDIERLKEAIERNSTGGKGASAVPGRRKLTAPSGDMPDWAKRGDGGAPSLFGQIKSVVSAVPGGLVHLGGSALDSTVGNIGAVAAAATGQSAEDVRKMSFIGRALVNEDTLETASREGLSLNSLKAALPLPVEVGQSVQDTRNRILDQGVALIPGGKPAGEGAYAKASREGTIVPTLVEDVGNAAMVVAVAGQGLAAGGRAVAARAGRGAMTGRPIRAALTANEGLPVAGRLGQAAERGAAVARRVDEGLGKALLTPLRAPAIANRATRTLTGRSLVDRLGTASPRLTAFADQWSLSPRTRALREAYAGQRQWAAGQVQQVADAAQRSLTAVDSPSEAIAGMFRAGGVAESVSRLGDLPPEMRATVAEGMLSDPVFRDALHGASQADYTNGLDLAIRSLADPDSIDPAVRSRIERSQEAWDDVAPMLEENFREQVGVLDPRASEVTARLAGSELLDFNTRKVEQDYADTRAELTDRQERLAKRRSRIEAPDKPTTAAEGVRAGRLQERAGKLDRELSKVSRRLAKLDAEQPARIQGAMEKVTSAPARYRIAINAGQAASRAINDILAALDPEDIQTADLLRSVQADLVTDAVRAVDQLEAPRFIQGGRVTGGRVEPSRSPAARTTKGERLKEGAVPSLTDTDQAVLVSREIFTQARNEVVRFIIDRYGRQAGDLVDDPQLRGAALLEEANAAAGQPMVAWQPTSPFDTVKAKDVTPETLLIPKWAKDSFDGEYGPAGSVEALMQSLVDTPTRLWKHSVLALSPRWHVANMVGNFLMAWGGGVSPARQLELLGEAKQLLRDGELPQRLRGSGLSAETSHFLDFASSLSDQGQGPTRSALREFRDPSNRLQRSLRRPIESAQRGILRPFNPESRLGEAAARTADVGGRAATAASRPVRTSYNLNGWVDDLTHAVVYLDRMKKGVGEEQAVKEALRVAGDFTNLSKFERQVVRRMLPFWSWMKHITGLTYDLAANHPLRSAWLLHLWSMFSDGEDLSDIPHLRGSIQTGPTSFVRGANFMPFGTVSEFDVTDPVATIGAAANPFGKLAIEGTTGLEFGPGGLAPLSRPHGTGRTDEYGNPVQGPLSLTEFGHRALRLTPQTRAAQQLLRPPEDRVVRYDTGQPVRLKGRYGRHTIPDENAQTNSEIVLRNLLGLPIPIESDPREIRARRDAKTGGS